MDFLGAVSCGMAFSAATVGMNESRGGIRVLGHNAAQRLRPLNGISVPTQILLGWSNVLTSRHSSPKFINGS